MELKKVHPTYGAATRLVHAGLALAVVVQLSTSLWMDPDEGGDSVFQIHQTIGLTAFGLVLVFWLVALFRQRGTPLGQLLPWFSATRRRAVWQDLVAHLRDPLRLGSTGQVAGAEDALASAIHGLGLLLITAMAASGGLYFLVNTGDPDAGGLVAVAMVVHTTLANLVWAYLIGHAAMAIVQSMAGRNLGRMWSLAQRD